MTGRLLSAFAAVLLVSACVDPTPPPPAPEAAAATRADTSAPGDRPPTDAPAAESTRVEPDPVPLADVPPKTATPSPIPEPEPDDGRYAVLVGIDDYPGDGSDLPSGAHDVAAMRALLVGHFGYRPDRVRTLTDRGATRGAIRRAIRDHLGRAQTSALLYVSGHGVRLDGNTGRADAERDGRDEALYVWADDRRHSALIADDEIGAWMGALAARHAVVVLDACHSGTGARGGPGPAVKEVKAADVEALLDPAAPWTRPVGAGARPVVLMAAARDQEVAFAGLDGRPSLFTDALVAVLGGTDAATSLADAMRQVASRVRAASRNLGSEHRPQFEGGAGLSLADVFSR